jgi:two-component system OmpR family sensor kinase
VTVRRRALGPLVAAAIGLAGALAATLSLHGAAIRAIDRVLQERLTGAGEAAAALLAGGVPASDRLLAIMRANDLDGAYVIDRRLRVSADASGPSGRRADLLRLDPGRVERALGGAPSVAPGYTLGTLTVMTGTFPIRGGGDVTGVLVLEAGQAFVAPRAGIMRALALGVGLSLLSALGLAMAAARWSRAERERREATVRAAQGTALSRVAAMAAHEIRNPLGVIRGTVDLMRERAAATLTERDRRALDDIGEEVERLRRLTQDLVDLAADKPLALEPTLVGELLAEAARATEAAFPGVSVRCDFGALPPLQADPTRLRQVFVNLLANAAQAQRHGEIHVRAASDGRAVRVVVQDAGPGIPEDVGDRLFDLYFTTKSGGTGLGLAIARRFVERHGGTLVHLRDRKPGAAFEVALPVAPVKPRRIEEG